jgi:carbamoyl-phosphate synthase L subunit-like protein
MKDVRRIVYVSRQMTGESLRSAKAIERLHDIELLGICEDPPDSARSEVFTDLICISRADEPDLVVAAAKELAERRGPLHQLVSAQEPLLDSVAQANEQLKLQGMSLETVRGTLNKARFRQTLSQAGIKTLQHKIVTTEQDATMFAREAGLPIVLKPLSGSGALGTWSVRNAEQLESALELFQPTSEKALLAEQYVVGREIAIDTITIDNDPRFYSVCYYDPPILEALEHSQTQWTCIMPRSIGEACDQEVIESGLAAIRSLRVGNAMTHMEALLPQSSPAVFIDATLRPAGARIGPMLGFAYDIDPHFAWARAVIDGAFDGPWERRYAVGTIFIRGQGAGVIEHVSGLQVIKDEMGQLIVDARLPLLGAAKAASYTGDGYITVRHPETRVVEQTLRSIAETVRITYSQSEKIRSTSQIRFFDPQMTKPAWEDDSLPTL